MVKLGFVSFLLVQSVHCAFFDLTDVDDPLSLLWHTKGPGESHRRICHVIGSDGAIMNGICEAKSKCLLSGGQLNVDYKKCGVFSTCCIQSTCSRTTSSKVSYFSNDGFNTNLGECTYTVEAMNDHVCQMRLDFEIFELSPSEKRNVNTGDATIQHTICPTDSMTVSPNTYNIPVFCGNNDKQHVYVHLHSNRQVILQMHLENRETTQITNVITDPHWKIKITQLECPGPWNFFTKHNALFSSESNDFRLLAPEGAIQYFLKNSGQIRSFNYKGGSSEYLSGLSYAIAFRRTPNVDCVRFTSNSIKLRHQVITDNTTVCIDYLFIPGLLKNDVATTTSQICPTTSRSTNTYSLAAPGPFYIYFYTAPTYAKESASALFHFDMQYEITSCK